MKLIFKGSVISFCGRFALPQSSLVKMVVDNGGQVEKTFTNRCTHLVTTTVNYMKKTNNVKKAIENNAAIVTEHFVTVAVRKGKRIGDSTFSIHNFIKATDASSSSESEDSEQEEEVEEVKTKKKTQTTIKQAKEDKEEEEEEEEVKKDTKMAKRKRDGRVKNEAIKEEAEEQDNTKKEDKKKQKTKEVTRFQPFGDGESLLLMNDIVAMFKGAKMIFYNCAQQQFNTLFNTLFQLVTKSLAGSKDISADNCLEHVFHPILLKTLDAKLKKGPTAQVESIKYLNKDKMETKLTEIISEMELKPALLKCQVDRLLGVIGMFVNDFIERVTEHRARHKQKWTSHTNIRHIVSESVTLSSMFPELDTYCKPTGPRAQGRPKKVYFSDENNHI